jgi:integrase/recombinase XerC
MIEAFLQHIAYEKRLSPHTYTAYAKDLEQFAEFLLKQYEITTPETATFPIIRSWTVQLVESGLHHRSVNRKLATLRSFFEFLLRKKVVIVNPLKRIPPLKTDKKLPAYVEEKAIDLLLEEVEFTADFEGIRDQLVMELLYGTGIRLSELTGLKNNDVNYYDQTLSVLGKRNKQRLIPLHTPLVKLIKDYQAEKQATFGELPTDALVLTNKGEPAYGVLIQRIVKKYLTLVTSITQRSPHVLRHTFATHLLNQGADLNAIKDLLGHSSLSATQIYTHNSIEKIKKIYQQAHPKA